MFVFECQFLNWINVSPSVSLIMKEVFHCLTPLSPKRNDEMLRQGNYGSDPKPTPPFDKSVWGFGF